MAGKQVQTIHISWLVAWFSLAATGGIALAAVLHTAYAAQGIWLGIAAVLAAACVKRTAAMVVLVIASGLAVGLWRGNLEQAALRHYLPLINRYVTIQGTVSSDATYGPGGDLRLTLQHIHIGSYPLHGQVWVSMPAGADIRRSDVVTVSGKLSAGFGNIPASIFRARLIHLVRREPGDIGLQVRDWFARGIRRAIPEPQASLASGYLTGQQSALPAELNNQLQAAGLTHAVVASGYNLTILVGVARQLLLGVSKYLAFISAAGMIAAFMAITGLSPSMSRAGLVTGLSLAAWYYGRRIHPLVLLPFAAAVTALINPSYVWGDIGWYLSFVSFGGVIVLAPLVHRFFWGMARPGVVRQIFVDTLCAQVATLPVIIAAFGHYSPYALLANLLVLPLIPLTMLLAGVAGLAGCVLPGAAHLAGMPATLVLHYMTAVIAWTANLPGAQATTMLPPVGLAGAYALLLLAAVFLWRRTRYDFRADLAPPVSAPEA